MYWVYIISNKYKNVFFKGFAGRELDQPQGGTRSDGNNGNIL